MLNKTQNNPFLKRASLFMVMLFTAVLLPLAGRAATVYDEDRIVNDTQLDTPLFYGNTCEEILTAIQEHTEQDVAQGYLFNTKKMNDAKPQFIVPIVWNCEILSETPSRAKTEVLSGNTDKSNLAEEFFSIKSPYEDKAFRTYNLKGGLFGLITRQINSLKRGKTQVFAMASVSRIAKPFYQFKKYGYVFVDVVLDNTGSTYSDGEIEPCTACEKEVLAGRVAAAKRKKALEAKLEKEKELKAKKDAIAKEKEEKRQEALKRKLEDEQEQKEKRDKLAKEKEEKRQEALKRERKEELEQKEKADKIAKEKEEERQKNLKEAREEEAKQEKIAKEKAQEKAEKKAEEQAKLAKEQKEKADKIAKEKKEKQEKLAKEKAKAEKAK